MRFVQQQCASNTCKISTKFVARVGAAGIRFGLLGFGCRIQGVGFRVSGAKCGVWL